MSNKLSFKCYAPFMSKILNLFKPISSDELVFNINLDGINSKQVDTAHILMLNLDIDSDGFIGFKTNNEFSIAFDGNLIREFLNLLQKNKPLSIILDDKNNKLLLRGSGSERTLDLYDVDGYSKPKILNIDLDVYALVTKQDFKKALSSIHDNHIKFVMNKKNNTFQLKPRNEDSIKDKIFIPTKNDISKNSINHYNKEYLSDIVNALPDGNLTMQTSSLNDYPLKIYYEDYFIKATYLLAPIIETE